MTEVQGITLAEINRSLHQEHPGMGREGLKLAAEHLFLGDAEGMRIVLRLLVSGTIGFPALAAETGIHEKSLHRMLSKRGNPQMDKLAIILAVLNKREQAFVAPTLDPGCEYDDYDENGELLRA